MPRHVWKFVDLRGRKPSDLLARCRIQDVENSDDTAHREHGDSPAYAKVLREVDRMVDVSIAALLTAFDVFLVAPIVSGRLKEPGLWALLASSVALTYFFASVGYRLIRARPNSVGSIASLATWFTCFGLLVALSLTFVVAAIVKRDLLFAQGAALSGLLALLAFGAASHFHRKR